MDGEIGSAEITTLFPNVFSFLIFVHLLVINFYFFQLDLMRGTETVKKMDLKEFTELKTTKIAKISKSILVVLSLVDLSQIWSISFFLAIMFIARNI